MMDFKYILKELRTEKSISQLKLAQVLQVHQSTISDWEKRGTQPPIEMLIKIAEYFEVSLDYLCGVSAENQTTIKTNLKRNEQKALALFRRISPRGQDFALGYLEGLATNSETAADEGGDSEGIA